MDMVAVGCVNQHLLFMLRLEDFYDNKYNIKELSMSLIFCTVFTSKIKGFYAQNRKILCSYLKRVL